MKPKFKTGDKVIYREPIMFDSNEYDEKEGIITKVITRYKINNDLITEEEITSHIDLSDIQIGDHISYRISSDRWLFDDDYIDMVGTISNINHYYYMDGSENNGYYYFESESDIRLCRKYKINNLLKDI